MEQIITDRLISELIQVGLGQRSRQNLWVAAAGFFTG